MDCGPPGSSVHGILQASILGWVATPSSRRSSQPRDRTLVSWTAGGFFTSRPNREACIKRYQVWFPCAIQYILDASLFYMQFINLIPLIYSSPIPSLLWEPQVWFYIYEFFSALHIRSFVLLLDSICDIIKLFVSLWLTSLRTILSMSIQITAKWQDAFFMAE